MKSGAIGEYFVVCEKLKTGKIQSTKYEGVLKTFPPLHVGPILESLANGVRSKDLLVTLVISTS